MQHTEPFENEAIMSDQDYNKLQTIGKWTLVVITTIPTVSIILCLI